MTKIKMTKINPMDVINQILNSELVRFKNWTSSSKSRLSSWALFWLVSSSSLISKILSFWVSSSILFSRLSQLFKFWNTSGTQVGPHLTNFWPNQESQPEIKNYVMKEMETFCWQFRRNRYNAANYCLFMLFSFPTFLRTHGQINFMKSE